MLPPKVKTYLLKSLEGAPDVYDVLTMEMTEADADKRPDPDRFTIREALAHLAEWEGVFRQRLIQTRYDDNPALQGYDEGQWAIDHCYAHADWRAQLQIFRARRSELVALLHTLTPAEWERTGIHTEIGLVTAEQQVVMIAAHDGYHETQVAQWRRV
jgi:hypothetical protein